MERSIRILSDDEIAAGALRIRERSHQPLEIARLEVQDQLDAAGGVRRVSVLREQVAITCHARPLCFRSARLEDALDAYLSERVCRGAGLGVEGPYRNLAPRSRLFLSASGKGFQITPYGDEGQKRFSCPGIQETYRKLFRYAELECVTALTARHTLADRLYTRGADESQVGLLLGIAERSAVREQFPRRQRTLEQLTLDLVVRYLSWYKMWTKHTER